MRLQASGRGKSSNDLHNGKEISYHPLISLINIPWQCRSHKKSPSVRVIEHSINTCLG